MERSAVGLEAVLSVEELLVGTGSGVLDATDAVLVMVPVVAGAMSTTTVITPAVAPAARGPVAEQVTDCRTAPQVQPDPVADTNVRPAGSVSDTTGALASDGPWLVTVRVYVPGSPGTSVPTWTLVMERSAEVVTGATTEAVLFEVSGSYVVDETDAVFDTGVVPLSAGTLTNTSIGDAVAPAARGPVAVQVRAVGAVAQDHPVPEAEAKVQFAPGGTESVTTGAVAGDGPWLVTPRTKKSPDEPATNPPTVPTDFAMARSAAAMNALAVAVFEW